MVVDPLWLFLNVEDDKGIMSITQQLNSVNVFENKNVNNNNNNESDKCEACFINDPTKPQQNNNQQIIEASSMFNPFRNQEDTANNNCNEDDKRPDFYDEMFS